MHFWSTTHTITTHSRFWEALSCLLPFSQALPPPASCSCLFPHSTECCVQMLLPSRRAAPLQPLHALLHQCWETGSRSGRMLARKWAGNSTWTCGRGGEQMWGGLWEWTPLEALGHGSCPTSGYADVSLASHHREVALNSSNCDATLSSVLLPSCCRI